MRQIEISDEELSALRGEGMEEMKIMQESFRVGFLFGSLFSIGGVVGGMLIAHFLLI